MARRRMRMPLRSLGALACLLGAPGALAQGAVTAEPSVLNRRDVAVPLVEKLLGAGLVPDGTLFVPVRVADDGTLVPAIGHGLLARHATVERVIREATSAMKVSTPRAWLAANPERRWAVFWMFQSADCDERVYAAPERVLPARVCLRIRNGRADVDGARVLFDVADRVAAPDPVRLQGADRRRVMPYPSKARNDYVQGSAVARVTVGGDGRASSVGIVSDQPPGVFRAPVEDFLRKAEWTGVPSGPGAHVKLIAFEFLMSPCISVPDAIVADRVTVCTSRPP